MLRAVIEWYPSGHKGPAWRGHKSSEAAICGCSGPNPNRTWLILAAYAGLRGCEIAIMRGEDIDWAARKIHVPRRQGRGSRLGATAPDR